MLVVAPVMHVALASDLRWLLQVLESEKRKNLTSTQSKTSTPHPKHAPGWNESLASASEAHVKVGFSTSFLPKFLVSAHLPQADKSDSDPQTMAAETVEYVQRRHHPEERTSSHSAPYERDSVGGPLSGAGVQEKKTTIKEETTEFRTLPTATESEETVRSSILPS